MPALPIRPGGAADGVDALLADGTVVAVRPTTPDDLAGLLELHRSASDRSRRMRFSSTAATPADRYARHLADGREGHLAVVAERDGALLGVASAEPVSPGGPGGPAVDEAEVALFVGDRWQHTGVGTLLLEHLAALARATGIRRFRALVQTDNAAMLDVFAHAGFAVRHDAPAAGQVVASIDLQGGRALVAAVAERERRATAASIVPILSPRSVVVVGASRRPAAVGHAVLQSIEAAGFTGRLAAVNHRVLPGATIAGVPAYSSVAEVPWRADLAVIAVPASEVGRVLDGCGRAGVRGAVVLTGGFAEAGDREGQADLVRVAHRHGMRLIGPNCLGVINTDPAVRLDATFASTALAALRDGGVGVAAQSGALGIAVLDAAVQRGLGISGFVSLGNKADVSGNDLLLYWAADPRTRVVALYLESVGNPRRFRRIAAQVAWSKPVVALRSGRSLAGARAGLSHTAAAATPDAVTAALFRDAGVIAVETTEDLVDTVRLLAAQPVPDGRRVLIVGNAGGPGALAADAAAGAGAVVPALTPGTAARLRAAVGGAASFENPVDLGATADPERYGAAVGVLIASGEADAVVVLHVVTQAQPVDAVIAAVEQAVDGAGQAMGRPPVTLAGAVIGGPPPRHGVLPWYAFAESAARAVARAGGLGLWRAGAAAERLLPETAPSPSDLDLGAVAALLAAAPRSSGGWLHPGTAIRLLELIGVPVCPTRAVHGVEAAVAVAAALDGPVVVKSAAPGLTHKSERGAVALHLLGERSVAEAARRICAVTGSDDLVVQPEVAGGVELLVGLATTGGVPVAMVAAGGIHEAMLADRVLRTLPLAPGAAAQMLGELRCAPLLSGDRGSPALDRASAADVLQRIALLDVVAPQIRELDVNPLVVAEHGVTAVDAKVRLAVPGEAPPCLDLVRDRYERALG